MDAKNNNNNNNNNNIHNNDVLSNIEQSSSSTTTSSAFIEIILGNDDDNNNNNSISCNTTTSIKNNAVSSNDSNNDDNWYNNSNEYILKSKEIFQNINDNEKLITNEFINTIDSIFQLNNNNDNIDKKLLVIRGMIRILYILLTLYDTLLIHHNVKSNIFQTIVLKLTSYITKLQNNNSNTNNDLLVDTFEELFKHTHVLIIKNQNNMKKSIMSEYWKLLCKLSKEIHKQKCNTNKKVNVKVIFNIINIFINYLQEGIDNNIITQ